MKKRGRVVRRFRPPGPFAHCPDQNFLVEVEIPRAPIEKVLITDWIHKVDFVVNFPVIKTHRSVSYSISLKNFIGCTRVRKRPHVINSRPGRRSWLRSTWRTGPT
jgi:uncharacterized protein (DUF362 family)